MKHILNFIPQKVRHLRDWADFVLKSVFDQFVEDTEAALDSKLDQEDGDARYGRLGAANTWSQRQNFGSFASQAGGVTSSITNGFAVLGQADTGAGVRGSTRSATAFGVDALNSTPTPASIVRAICVRREGQYQSNGTGVGILYRMYSSTTDGRDAAAIDAVWTDSTDATRTSAITFSTVSNGGALTEQLRISPSRIQIFGTGQIAVGSGTALIYSEGFNRLQLRGSFIQLQGNDGVNATPITLQFKGGPSMGPNTPDRLEINNGTGGTYRDLIVRNLYSGDTQVIGSQQPAIEDSDGSEADNARAINEILNAMRTHGLIATT